MFLAKFCQTSQHVRIETPLLSNSPSRKPNASNRPEKPIDQSNLFCELHQIQPGIFLVSLMRFSILCGVIRLTVDVISHRTPLSHLFNGLGIVLPFRISN